MVWLSSLEAGCWWVFAGGDGDEGKENNGLLWCLGGGRLVEHTGFWRDPSEKTRKGKLFFAKSEIFYHHPLKCKDNVNVI